MGWNGSATHEVIFEDCRIPLENMLGGLITNNSKKQEQSFLESILDADGDGSIIDDVADMVLGNNKKKSGLGGILGGLFGKK